MKNIKIAYIGGGSKQWARVFMNDLALCSDLTGEIGLFDIDKEAAVRNQQIGNNINKQPETVRASVIRQVREVCQEHSAQFHFMKSLRQQ